MLLPNLRVSNGVTSYAINYFRNIDHEKIQIDFAIYKKFPSPYISEIETVGGNIYVLPPIKKIYMHIKQCRKIIRNGNYDIIHNNSLHITIPMMLCAKKRVPIRILHSHNSKLGESNKKEARNKLFLPLLCSTATHNAACSKLAGKNMFGDKTFTLIPNVINPELFRFDEKKRLEVRKDMNAENKFIIATVGRVSEQKNPFWAMDVFKKLIEIDETAEYWWIGSGVLDKQLKLYIEKLGIKNRVKLLGNREDISDLYQAIDVFFLPSLFEGLPITSIEAQAMGVPCVLSNSITKELVYTDLVNYISLEDSLEKWVESIERVKSNNISREKYNLKLCKSIYSDSNAGDLLYEWYKKLIKC